MNKKLSPGDEVVFVNSYGVCFGKDKVKELRDISYGETGRLGVITENTDTPWFASDMKHYRDPNEDTREVVYCYITGKRRMLSKCQKCNKKHYVKNSHDFRDGIITYKELL